MNVYTAKQLFNEIASQLKGLFSNEELQSLQKLIFLRQLGIPHHQLYLNPSLEIAETQVEIVQETVRQLKQHKPIQYILGETEFFGLPFEVNRSVLIPRPETEELVDWVIKTIKLSIEVNPSPRILDIGTGSGCIAISLAANLPQCNIFALDISQEALTVAKQNALLNKVTLEFINADILNPNLEIKGEPFDIIVSNPPYVRDSEKKWMMPNVLENEPHQALFVTDSDPLLFYRVIGQQVQKILKRGGKIFCEINEALGEQTKRLFLSLGMNDVEVRKDLNGKDRMLIATYNG